jgi:Protein of unknown function (DUF3102)
MMMNTQTNTPSDTAQAFDGSNSLADLAARIRAFHEAAAEGLRRSVENGMAAGDLLIEAKAQLKHGQWLPWLRDHCAISERTAQLYMRCAKNRAAIEEQAKSATVADLTLNEAAAVLMLSSDVRKLFAFAKRLEDADPEDVISICAEEGIATIRNPFGAKEWSELSDAERLEWPLWILFGVKDLRVSAEEAAYYTDRLQSRGWTLTEWYGAEGDSYRRRCELKEMWQSSKDAWRAFLENNRGRTLDDVEAEIARLDEARIEKLTTRTKPAPRRTANNRRAPSRNKRTEASTALAR